MLEATSLAALPPADPWREGRWTLGAGGLQCATAAVQQHQAASAAAAAPAVLARVAVAADTMATLAAKAQGSNMQLAFAVMLLCTVSL